MTKFVNNTPFKRAVERTAKPQPAAAVPTINVKAVSAELNQRFADVTRPLRNNSKGTHLYDWQVEFAYIMDNITRGPKYIIPKFVSVAHHLINTIDSTIKMENFNNLQKPEEA